jgi:hypothetical protein
MSYATSSSDRSQELVWVWDKVAQTAEAARLLERAQGGRFTHMPVLASLARAALEPESVSSETAAVLHGIVEANEPVVIKPRHGANSHAIALFTSPSDAGAEQLLAACRAAAAVDSARLGEPFQLTRVPPGAIIVPMYAGAPGQEAGNGRWAGAAPLELKVQTLFGVVVGATLHTHPWQFWVLASGALHAWQDIAAHSSSHHGGPPRKWKQLHGGELGEIAVETLRQVLRDDWQEIASLSAQLSQRAGLDELRVDWLVGDQQWGSRIGELTYVGGAERLVPVLSKPFALAYLAGHRQRLLTAMPAVASLEGGPGPNQNPTRTTAARD